MAKKTTTKKPASLTKAGSPASAKAKPASKATAKKRAPTSPGSSTKNPKKKASNAPTPAAPARTSTAKKASSSKPAPKGASKKTPARKTTAAKSPRSIKPVKSINTDSPTKTTPKPKAASKKAGTAPKADAKKASPVKKAEAATDKPAKKAAPKPTKSPGVETASAETQVPPKQGSKGVAKKVVKKSPSKAAPSDATPAGNGTEKPASKKPDAKADKDSKPTAKPEADTPQDDDADKKAGRKGITVVTPAKKPPSKSKPVSKYNPPVRPMLLGPGSKFNKPLIPSGPSAPKPASVLDAPKSKRTKSPLTKQKLDKYRALLIAKRAELRGDVVSMENEALRSESGELSNTPQHLAEQGSETYDQSLSLNLAAQDRRVIREIDEALKRIDEGTYGLCELTNQPIPEERLDEIPWARYTIEAARQLESRGSVL